jgi:hypothetical protein
MHSADHPSCNFDWEPTIPGMPNPPGCPPTLSAPLNPPDVQVNRFARLPDHLLRLRRVAPAPHRQEPLVQLWIPHFCKHYLRTFRPLHEPGRRFHSQWCPWEGITSSPFACVSDVLEATSFVVLPFCLGKNKKNRSISNKEEGIL